MESVQESAVTATLTVENVGGISSTEVELTPGITALVGRNATNRTSLLQAIIGALGGEEISLNSGADTGRVELRLGSDIYTRELTRRDGTVHTSGSPYLQGQEARKAELFAFLHEGNEARRAVERGGDLREVLMDPIDTADIEGQIDRLRTERTDLENQLEELDKLADKLPGLEEERASLTSQIESLESELDEKRAALNELDGSLEANQEHKEELAQKVSELEKDRSELSRVKREQRTERRSIDSLQDELTKVENGLDELPGGPRQSVAELESELEQVRSAERKAKTELSQLQSIIQFNEEMLSDGGISAIADSPDTTADPGELLPENSQDVTCWTCGSTVEREAIEETLTTLRSVRASTMDRRSELRERIDELQETIREVRDQEEERERLETRLAATEDELAQRRERLDDLEKKRRELEDEIAQLEQTVADLNEAENDELLELNREVNQVEFELDDLAERRADVEAEIEEIESALERREELTEKRDELSEEITDLRTRVERIEGQAVDAFNEHMDELLGILGYDNIDRVWIEQVQRKVKDGRRTVTKAEFDLHIVRSTDDAVYEDSVGNLSESERELIGLVFALAGYLVHEVHESVPFMVLDSLEAIDANRIADLLAYFADYAEYLVVALLTEDAQALAVDHDVVADI